MHKPISDRTALVVMGSVFSAALLLVAVAYWYPAVGDFLTIHRAPAEQNIAAAGAKTWRSALYPANWQPNKPDAQDRFLQDFSYAGYHQGERAIPNNPPGLTYDVTKPPYNADATGVRNSTAAIQKAMDDAGAAGGGVVYLPKGTYKVGVQRTSDTAVLYLKYSGVVLRGAGPAQTFIKNVTTNMHAKSVILVGAVQASLRDRGLGNASLRAGLAMPTAALSVSAADTAKFAVGDWVVVRSDLTAPLIKSLGMTGKWKPNAFLWTSFVRQITGVNSQGAIVLDIPTRYPLYVRDNAQVYKINPPIQEAGIESLSMGNVKNPLKKGWGEQDWRKPGTGAYQVDNSALIRVSGTANSWIRNVKSYAPAGNGSINMLSHGIVLNGSARSISIINVAMRNTQYKGGGGNGYGFVIQGGENLVQNAVVANMRHNLAFTGTAASGNVILKGVFSNGRHYTETHAHFSAANLFDSVKIGGGEKLISEDRGDHGDSYHGLTSSQTVFWNIKGKGQVVSQQYGWGYVIGTAAGVSVSTNGQGSNALTSPADYIEGRGQGTTLRPQSLYLDQLARRLRTAAAAAPATLAVDNNATDDAQSAADATSPDEQALLVEDAPADDQSTGETPADAPINDGDPQTVEEADPVID